MTNDTLDENLIGYLLDALDETTRAEVAARLEKDEEARWRLEQLRQALEPLAADRDQVEVPKGLAIRTLARVAELRCVELSRAPALASRLGPPRSWWRRADVAVAASVLILGVGMGLPAMSMARARQAMVECEQNMAVFNNALHVYHDQHGHFPSVADERPYHAAGMVVPILAKVSPELNNIRCPGGGPGTPCPLTWEQARSLPVSEFYRQADKLVPSYAYSLGYQDEEGNYYGPMVPEGQEACDTPIMADSPPRDGGDGNSDNHGGAGQWMLFADGHASFVKDRKVGALKDDIYRNKANIVAAGLDPCDIVLGHGSAKP
jgi:hypothetical protein